MNKIYAICSPLRLVKVFGGFIYEVSAYSIYDRKPENLDPYYRQETATCIGYGSIQGFGKTPREAKVNFWKKWNDEHRGIYLDTGHYEPQYCNDTV